MSDSSGTGVHGRYRAPGLLVLLLAAACAHSGVGDIPCNADGFRPVPSQRITAGMLLYYQDGRVHGRVREIATRSFGNLAGRENRELAARIEFDSGGQSWRRISALNNRYVRCDPS